jgi:hypothetical protein
MQDAHSQVVEYSMHDTSDSYRNRHRLRITFSALAVLAFAVCFLAVPVMAHTPTAMTIKFDPNTAKLYVTITHPVDDPTTHYLSKVQVKLNGQVISDPPYKSQPSKDMFTLTYDVNANPGDAVWVVATCVKGGTLEKNYDVPQPVSPTSPAMPVTSAVPAASQPPATVPPTTRAAAGILPVLGAFAVLMIRKN